MDTIQPSWEESFHANNRNDDISPEMLNYGTEYHAIENKLLSSYCPVQMEMYVRLQSMDEGFIAELDMSFYSKGYTDALKVNEDT
jgi:hypothetical protein